MHILPPDRPFLSTSLSLRTKFFKFVCVSFFCSYSLFVVFHHKVEPFNWSYKRCSISNMITNFHFVLPFYLICR